MKKLLVVFLLLIILFNNTTVLAEGVLLGDANENVTDNVTNDATGETQEVIAEQQEIKQETQVEQPEITKEEITVKQPEIAKEEVKEEVKAFSAPKTEDVVLTKGATDELDPEAEAAAHDNKKDVHRVCINFIDTAARPSYRVNSSSCATTNGSKFSKAFNMNYFTMYEGKISFTYGNSIYLFEGWYDEEGNKVTTYYNGDETRIKVSYTYNESKCQVLNYYTKWSELKQPIYNLYIYDKVSTGDQHWGNTNGSLGNLTHTFATPDVKTHYKFLYYKLDNAETTYQPGDTYFHDITAQGYNTDVLEEGYAYWQADVTVNLYSDNKLISSSSSFENITVDTEPTKFGYKFLGWTDKDGNAVTELTFAPEKSGIEPKPVIVNLYAKWEQIMIDVDVAKVWNDNNNQDGIRHDSVKFNLMNGGEVVDSIILSEDNGWKHTFIVPEFDDEAKINYTVVEEKIADYESETNGNMSDGYIIINSHKPAEISISIENVWEDNNNQDGVRPNSVTVKILADGKEIKEVILSEENNWEAEISELPKNANGTKIEYTLSDVEVDKYDTEITGNVEDGFVITNTHKPEEISITVSKIWEDSNNQDGVRPNSIMIILLANGEKVKEITLDNEQEWIVKVDHLPKYNKGKEIEYTVSEIVIDVYESKITGDMVNGFVITNFYSPKGKEEVNEETNPKTADNFNNDIINLIMSFNAATIAIYLLKKYN